uniref:Mannose-binding protein A n=1 Tax=Actinobacteria phage HS02 TaxID=3056388 RepID=A0AA50AC90_9VIRU|nr:MAG: mannose-binding protein A [Actinobacteria phage HS02]
MHRTSTDLEYYRDKKLVIDADGVEVTLPLEPFELAAGAEEAARSAKSDADRTATIASSTSWNGDRLTVNGKTSPSLTGPKGPPGDVSKAQLDAAIEAVKATISRTKPVYFTTDDGSTWYVVGSVPAGWNIWTAGRIYPPAGKYWVEMSDGASVENRPTQQGTALKQAAMVTVTDGGYLLAMYTKPGHTIKITPIT